MTVMLRSIALAVLTVFLVRFLPAQTLDGKTAAEHQAVKSYVSSRLGGQLPAPVSPTLAKPNAGAAGLAKTTGVRDRKSYLMNGNRITTEVYNYGGIGPGYGLIRGVNNLVWRNLSYGFQFGPIVGASVPDPRTPGKRMHIISDGLNDYPNLREVSPMGDTLWQWEPLPGYADPDQSDMASNPAPDADKDGKPDSWPRSWYNPTIGKYIWPGYLSQDVPSADLEVFWSMDDRDNAEFPYYPFVNDQTRRGIGLQVDGRGFQWSNPLAENAIFFVYTITNVSDKDLDSLFFGIYGDPDVGGGSPENTDDHGFFIPPYDSTNPLINKVPVYSRSLVYFWDPDMKGDRGLPLGFVACKFLESPGNPNDGIDNDGDGIIDERQDDGIDNDHDWNPVTDDVGIDGVPNTLDEGEGDGMPTAGKKLPDGSLDPLHPGEPNFELTDLDEADQIGLTSFNSWTWSADKISNDESMWARCIPRNFGSIQQAADIVFIFGSGYISLKKGETKRISMALLFGQTLDDLLTSAKTVQTIYNQNYRFFKPPLTPKLTAVPGDKKVTLYWDSKSEQSVDPISGKDFEGYVIYRSTDPSFGDIQTITDGHGSQFLSEPLKTVAGSEARWDVDFREEPYTDLNFNGRYDANEPFVDLNHDGLWSAHAEDQWKGFHPVPYQDRGVQYYLGNNSGLVHSFVDSNNVVNGQTYYYAVVAYDHGDSVGIPPTETTKKITVDPITSQLDFDVNTAMVIPGPRANGYVPPQLQNGMQKHESGLGTGPVMFKIVNDLQVPAGGQYRLTFADSLVQNNRMIAAKNYSLLDQLATTQTFTAFDTNYVQLEHERISADEYLKVTDKTGKVYLQGTDYLINYARGSIRRTAASTMPPNGEFIITYRYYPIFESRLLKGEDGNPAFKGIELTVTDEDSMGFDPGRSGWVAGRSNLEYTLAPPSVGVRKKTIPADYMIRFSASPIDSAIAVSNGKYTKVPVTYSVVEVTTGVPRPILTYLYEKSLALRNLRWDPGEEIELFRYGSTGATTDTLNWGLTVYRPVDTTIVPVLPTDGDVLFVGTSRPFTKEDVYTLQTQAGHVDASAGKSRLDDIYVVPNPYVAVSQIEPTNKLPGQTRGERRIYFEHLPQQCTIRIFTLNGDLVQILNHDVGVDNAREYWNLLDRDGFSIAYGVYVAHVDAPGIGEKLLKFAVIK